MNLAWDRNADPDIRNYNVYVGTAPGAHDISVRSVPASQTTFAFTASAGVLYYFAVSATNTAGAESPLSSEIAGSIPLVYPLSDRSSAVNLPIVTLYLPAVDPDGGTMRFSHVGLPLGLTLDGTSGVVTGTPTAVGSYNVTIFVTDGVTTSSQSFVWTVRNAQSGDTMAPRLSITSPTAGQSVPTATITVSGTATDNSTGDSGITSVTVNGLLATGGTVSTNGTANWSRSITLPSSNTIIVEAHDGAGNYSGELITVARTGSAPTPIAITGLTSDLGSPQPAGTQVTFRATATGGTGSYQFKWWLWNGYTWTMVRDWGSSTYPWTPTQANSNYRIGIWARDATSTVDSSLVNLSIPYAITTASSSTTSSSAWLSLGLTGNVASPQVIGASITFSATATGGTGPYQFKWWMWNGFNWTMVRDWGSATYTWTPTQPSAYYRIGIWARNASTTVDSGQFNLSIPYPVSPGAPLSLALTSSLPLPQTSGTTLAFTAAARGGSGSYQFKWWVYDGFTWSVARDWSSATFTWTPTQANANNRIGIWARDATSTLDSGQFNLSISVPITP